MRKLCRKCGYQWESRVLSPKACPNCLARKYVIDAQPYAEGLRDEMRNIIRPIIEILMLGRTRKGKYRDFVNVGIEAFVIGFFQQAQAYNINEEDMRDLVDDMRDTPIPDMINAIKNICVPRPKEVSRES